MNLIQLCKITHPNNIGKGEIGLSKFERVSTLTENKNHDPNLKERTT